MSKKTVSEYGKENYGIRSNGALILTKGEVRKQIDLSGETIRLLEKKYPEKGFSGLKPFIETLLYEYARK